MYLLVELSGMEAEAVASIAFGAIEREIGLHHHCRGSRHAGRVGRNSDAGGDAHLMPFDLERSGKTCHNPGRERCRGHGIACVSLHYRNPVAAKSRSEVGRSDGLLDSLGYIWQESVANRMTERIVDVLET